jgi:hypothetical protein
VTSALGPEPTIPIGSIGFPLEILIGGSLIRIMTAPVAVGKLLIVLRFDFGKERLTALPESSETAAEELQHPAVC